MVNQNDDLVSHYGKQWRDFDGRGRSKEEVLEEFHGYFDIFPFDQLPATAEGFDAGCGMGRWAYFVADKVKRLNLIEPSDAIEVAKTVLQGKSNVHFYKRTINDMPLPDNSQDFGYCLGVLHYIPDPCSAMKACVDKLKPGAPFLVYMYYNFENRPEWFKAIWRCTDMVRRCISRMPYFWRKLCTDIIALTVYWPLAKLSWVLEKLGVNVSNIPLSAVRKSSLYSMRLWSLDRFGSRIEHRFSKQDITTMMTQCGLERITFGTNPEVNWCAIGYKRGS